MNDDKLIRLNDALHDVRNRVYCIQLKANAGKPYVELSEESVKALKDINELWLALLDVLPELTSDKPCS